MTSEMFASAKHHSALSITSALKRLGRSGTIALVYPRNRALLGSGGGMERLRNSRDGDRHVWRLRTVVLGAGIVVVEGVDECVVVDALWGQVFVVH